MKTVDKISDKIEYFFGNPIVIAVTNAGCLVGIWLNAKDGTNLFISMLTMNMLLFSIGSARRDRKANAAVRDASILSNKLADDRLIKAEENLDEKEIDALREKIVNEAPPADKRSAEDDEQSAKKK